MLTIFFVNNNLFTYIIMVQITYSTINECLLESTGPFTYSYYTIEVVSATVISINNPEKKKDVTAVINSLISTFSFESLVNSSCNSATCFKTFFFFLSASYLRKSS